MQDITRPALRYHGGKWKLAPWIISHFSSHSIYTEIYGGGASVLLRKNRALGEVYNDLDSDLVNFFRVLRDSTLSNQLRQLLLLTPYSREDFEESYECVDDIVEQARRLVIRSFMGFGSAACNTDHKTGFRATATRGQTKRGPAYEWATYADCIPALTERLRGVILENRDGLDVLKKYDSAATLHYVDPTYPIVTRSPSVRRNNCYRFEKTDQDHQELAKELHAAEGMIVISGYACPLYDEELYCNWFRVEAQSYADGARDRTEVLWLNDLAANHLHAPKGLFSK